MAGKPQYSDAEILWFLKQVFEYKIKNEDLVCAGFKERFGRELKSYQHKYLKGRYGKDPNFNCPAVTGSAFLVQPARSEETQLPILPLVQDYTVKPSHTVEVHDNVGQGLNSSQTMDGYNNVGQGLNGSSSGMAVTNHYTTDRHPTTNNTTNNTANNTVNNTPRQTIEAPVLVPRRANLSRSSRMHTAPRDPGSESRQQAAQRAAAYQQAQAALHADEQVNRQLQNRQQVHGTQQNFEQLRIPGMPVMPVMPVMPQPQHPANQNPMLWSQVNIPPSTQQAHFSHGTQQAQGVAHHEVIASEQPHWTMNPYSGHQPPVGHDPHQATYIGNHTQERSTQLWIETQQHHMQARQYAAPSVYTGNHGQGLETGPWNGTQGHHLQAMEYSAPTAPGAVFSAPEQGFWEVAPPLGVPDLTTVRGTEGNQQEPGQGMQNPYERNGMPYPCPEFPHGQLQQSMPLSREESQQSMPVSYREPQQRHPLSRGEGEPLSRGDSQQSMPVYYRADSQQSMPASYRADSQQSMPVSYRADSQQSMPVSYREDSQQSMPVSYREPQQSEPPSRGDSQQSMRPPYRAPQQSEPLSHGDSQQSMPVSYREPQQSEPLSLGDSQQSMPPPDREPQQSEPPSRGDSQQSMPPPDREPQQSEPLSRGESQQSEPLSEGFQAAYENWQQHTGVRDNSPFSCQVIRILHLQQLLAGTSTDTENEKEQDGEEDDFDFSEFIHLQNAP